MISYSCVYNNQCKHCKFSEDNGCGVKYCYNCGDYHCSRKELNPHKCDPNRVKRHYASMEAANKRGDNPRLHEPIFSRQLTDGFEMLNHDEW